MNGETRAFKNLEDSFSKLELWNRMSESERQMMVAAAEIRQFPAGSSIYSPARQCLGMLIVETGVIKSSLISEEGKRATLFRLRAGEVCVLSMPCMLAALTFDIEITAEQESKLVIVPSRIFSRLASENVYLENFSYRVAMERFSSVVKALEQLLFLSLNQRIGMFLLNESAAAHSAEICLTQEQIAESIGSAREAVARGLKQMVQAELISVSRGKITIISQEGLHQLTE